MKGFDVLKVKSAVKDHSKMDLSRTHLTTMNFGEIMPLFAEETVPGDKISVNANYFSRMAPLVAPTYGKFSFKTVAGYVPYHMVAVDAEAYIGGKTTWEGQTPKPRYFLLSGLARFFASPQVCTTAITIGSATTTATSANCDYAYTEDDATTNYVFWTNAGKYYVKILNALGYAVPTGVDFRASSTFMTGVGNTKLSAYPLLAFMKLYNDYMSQSQRYNTSILSDTLYKIKYNISITNLYTSSTGNLTASAILNLLQGLYLNYENDYFTSAWQSPNAPLSGTESLISVPIPFPANGSSVVQQNNGNTYLQTGSATALNQRALDFLKTFDDWVRRNNYSGSRVVQQIYSRFGIKTDDYRSHYANVITTDTMPIQVGDVTSVASTNDAVLGEYAGKGIMNGSKGFSVKADDYGMVIVLGYFTVVPMNAYGFDRKVLRSAPLDWYNPEFDGLGADAISVGEFSTNPIVLTDTVDDNAVYGYTERYNAYRYGRDQITGDFRNYHDVAGNMNAWHTGRLVTGIRTAGNLVAQSTSVNTLPQTDSEYNRIFSITDGREDMFYLTCQFGVDAIRPMLSLNQVPKLGEGDTAVPRNGNVIA